MRLFQNTLVSLLITASIIIAGVTVFFLSVQGRPDASSELIPQADAAQPDSLAVQQTAVPQPVAVPEMTIVEGTTIQLAPVAGELVQRADSLPVVIPLEPTPVLDAAPLAPVVQGDGAPVATETLIPLIPTAVLLPTGTPIPTIGVVTAADQLVQPIIFTNHQVVAGETLYSISNRYGSAVELLADKGISSANLVPGNTISVPYPNPAYCPNMRTYVVREKDTVFRIASSYGLSIERIRDANGLDPSYSIDIAQVLCIPNS